MSKPGSRLVRALTLIRDNPESMAWPGTFATCFWTNDYELPNGRSGYTLHAQRNKVNAPMSSWWAAGYLGRLRKLGYIGGGYYGLRSLGGGRDPLYLTAKGLAVLQNASEAGENAVGGR
jgi:hypothetical protein